MRPIPQQTQAKKKAPKKKSINRKTEIFTAETLERLKLVRLLESESVTYNTVNSKSLVHTEILIKRENTVILTRGLGVHAWWFC